MSQARHYYNEIEPYAVAWLRNLMDAGHIPAGDIDTRSIEDVRPSDLAGYVQCHFFAGIGGWPLALALAGWPVDRPVWTGSCPCQPFSKAGRGDGFADQRHLWPSWFHLISQFRPERVFGEQVSVAIKHGWVDLVMADLEGQDYAVGIQILHASDVDAPHERRRLYFAADRIGQGVAGQLGGAHSRQARSWGWRGEEDLQAIADAPHIAGSRWPQPIIRRVDHGLSSCMGRLRAYGNAIVPQVAGEFIQAYVEARSLTHHSVREAA